jgi:citrate synthase
VPSSSPLPTSAGVTVLQSCITQITPDGLRYRGFAIEDLARNATYEDVAWLLWTGDLPSAAQRAAMLDAIAAGMDLPQPIRAAAAALPAGAPPIARLQVLLPLLPLYVPALAEDSTLPGEERAARLLGAFVALTGCTMRPEPPTDVPRSVAAAFLALVRGDEPPPEHVRALEQVLILYADHELNASTFAGRVAASTRADLVSAVLAALSTLRGPLHGGVDRHVRALIAAAEHEGARLVVERYVRAATPLPGFGHAVYREVDPRGVLMRDLARALAPAAGLERLLAVMEAIETEAARHGRGPLNVDFYTVPLYRALRIPDVLSTLVFATGRMAGWTAHILEQYADNRLIRPRAAYAGPAPRPWPVERAAASASASS